VITGLEIDVDFDPRRFLRWMTRNGILVAVRNPKNKERIIIGFRRDCWPPKKSLLNAKPIGLAYHIHRWFGSHLQTYITSKMKEVEVVDGMMQLDHRAHSHRSINNGAARRPNSSRVADQAMPCASGTGTLDPRSGKQYSSDTELWKGDLDSAI
jgi:hypothetical protein